VKKPDAGTTWLVEPADAGVRLDRFLADATRLASRSRAATAIARGKVFVNDDESSAAEAARRLSAGDRVRLWMDRPGSARRRPSPHRTSELDILYEDDDLIAINKPAGLLAVPLPRRSAAPSVLEYLGRHLRGKRRRPFVVHRIDRDTSGVVLFAKHAAASEMLKQQFLRHDPERVYLAVVYGQPTPPSGTWRDHLVWDQRAMIQKETHERDPKGSEAVCTYRTAAVFQAASLIEVRLVTGRRNQIRLQARLRGHTLVGESRYVYGPDTLRTIEFPRQALHAWRLTVKHPSTGTALTFESPVPDDFKALLERLKRRAN
jgi:23S rRNA pseudouridine1911/1915/1917 synthase